MQRASLEQTVDELKSTQIQLIQSEKMALLGGLTAGVAHEIQNPLNFVNNFSEVNAELIDVAVYTQQALEVVSKMAAIFNEPELQHDYSQKAAILKHKINTGFWDDTEGTYCDFYGTIEVM